MDDKNEKYNGWTNRSTWAVHLWFTNDEAAYAEYKACQSEVDLKDVWLSLRVFKGIDLTKVNWTEILKARRD